MPLTDACKMFRWVGRLAHFFMRWKREMGLILQLKGLTLLIGNNHKSKLHSRDEIMAWKVRNQARVSMILPRFWMPWKLRENTDVR